MLAEHSKTKVQALAFFAKSYLDPTTPGCMWIILQDYILQRDISDPNTTLGLAAAAVAPASFSRSRSLQVALTASNHKYIQTLAKAKNTVNDRMEATSS